MKLLARKENRYIDLYDGFYAEVKIEIINCAKPKFDLYITHSDYPEVRLKVASSYTKNIMFANSEKAVNDILLQADNYKEVWERKIQSIDANIRQFK